jgi:uncharacterized membrane protein
LWVLLSYLGRGLIVVRIWEKPDLIFLLEESLSMRTNLIAYVSTLIVFLCMDSVWITLAGGPVYKARLGSLMLDKPNLPVAAVFYLMYVVAVIVFAVLPALTEGSWIRALWSGALLGLTAYGAYDLTNQATLAGWSSYVSVVDMAWGTFVTAAVSVAGYFITRALV